MAIIKIETPFNIDLEFSIAPFNKRLLAWVIDIFVITVYFYLMMRFIYPWFDPDEGISSSAVIIVLIVPVLLYQLIFELFANGQTIGKKVVGIAVIDMAGHEPTWSQYAIRWILCLGNLFVYLIPMLILRAPGFLFGLLILYLPDFLSVIISAKSQRLGDLAAGTVVIDKNYNANISETIYLPIENTDYKPMFPQVMRLSDRDINGIRNLVYTKRPGRDTEVYMQQIAEKIKSVLSIQTDLHYLDFLEQLLFDYNYYTTRNTANS